MVAGTLQTPFLPQSRFENRVQGQPDNVRSLVALVNGEIVGQLGVVQFTRPRRSHVATFGMAVHDAWHGKGIGSALMDAMIDLCDNWLNVKRIEMEVFADNEAAIGLYHKFGFVAEGRAVAFAFRNGHYADVLRMARVRLPNGTD